MRRRQIVLFVLSLALSVLFGCSAQQASNIPETPGESAPPLSAAPTPAKTPPNPELSVVQSVAYAFGSGEDTLLYAGFEVKNTGNCPAYVDSVTADFEVEGAGVFSTEFQPVASQYDVVAPGGKSYVALWYPAKKELPQGAAVSFSAELNAKQSEQDSLALSVKNARVLQNYPGFSTVSGSLWNESGRECPLNVVYIAFYGADDNLLGVYHFTKNASVLAGEFKNFVEHMRQLPIGSLSENTVRIEAHAFGIE